LSRLGPCSTLLNLQFSVLANGVSHAVSHDHGPAERSTRQSVKAVVIKQCHSSCVISFYELQHSDTCGVTDIELPSKRSRQTLCVVPLAGRVSCKRLVIEFCASRRHHLKFCQLWRSARPMTKSSNMQVLVPLERSGSARSAAGAAGKAPQAGRSPWSLPKAGPLPKAGHRRSRSWRSHRSEGPAPVDLMIPTGASATPHMQCT
jgi:hypothetical protein